MSEAKNEYGSTIVGDDAGEAIDGPYEEVEVTVTVTVKAWVSTRGCHGEVRTDLVADLLHQIKDALTEEMPYQDGDRESGDLVQAIIEVEVVRN